MNVVFCQFIEQEKTDNVHLLFFGLFRSFGKGVKHTLQGIDKPIRSLELLRVKGIGCNYSSFDLLLMFEKQTEFDRNNNKSGTTSVHKLYHYMEFMLQFLRKLAESLEKNESFKATDKVTIYQVDKAHESSFIFIARNGGFGRVMFSLVSICPRGEGLGWVAVPGPMSLGVVCLVPCPFGGMPGPMSLLG